MTNRVIRVIKNKAQCANCANIIESKDSRDFVTCSCFSNTADTKGIYIDGGRSCPRAGGHMPSFIDLSEYEEIEI